MADSFMRQVEEFSSMMKQSMGIPLVFDQKKGYALWFDQRELRLRFFISVERTRRFFEGLSEGKLLATRCKKTGKIYFPPQVDCPSDPSDEVEWIELPREGELVAYTIIHTKPYTFSHYNNYTIGIARLTNGVQVLAWLRETDPGKIKIGMKVRVEIVKREPEGYITYELVPTQQKQ